jgi:hypothetical protein
MPKVSFAAEAGAVERVRLSPSAKGNGSSRERERNVSGASNVMTPVPGATVAELASASFQGAIAVPVKFCVSEDQMPSETSCSCRVAPKDCTEVTVLQLHPAVRNPKPIRAVMSNVRIPAAKCNSSAAQPSSVAAPLRTPGRLKCGEECTPSSAPHYLVVAQVARRRIQRRGHDLRRTFAQVDSARHDLIETRSHGPRGDIATYFVTPSGIGGGPNVTGTRSVTGPATGGGAGERLAVASDCHGCNEALDAAREAVAVARRLAMVADNAILNGDLQRARAALRDFQEAVATPNDDAEAIRRHLP